MKNTATALKWMLLLTKRLLKRPAIIAILCLIPLLSLGMSIASELQNGLLTIVVASDGDADKLAKSVMTRLERDADVVMFKICEDKDEAVKAVEEGKADAAWVLDSNFTDALRDHIHFGASCVEVYTKEDNSFTSLSREIMYEKLYPTISRMMYVEYNENWLGDIDGFDRDELIEYYTKYRPSESMINFKAVGVSTGDQSEANHLKTPIRGLLSVLTVLCSLASAMLISNDIKKGTFAWMRPSRHIWLYAASGISASLLASIVSLAALKLAGLMGNFFYEAAALLLFSLCGAGFTTLLALILDTPERIGASVVPLVVSMLVFTPIFVHVWIGNIAFALPNFSYIYSSAETKHIIYMIAYIAVVYTVCTAVNLIKNRKLL